MRNWFGKNSAPRDRAESPDVTREKQAALSERDINSLRDLALNLEDAAPFEAYALFRLALKHRPSGAILRKKVDELERRTMKNTVVAWRNDGLCERINSILLGRFAAKALGLDFKFLWPDLSYLQERYQIQFGQGHSVPQEARQLLAEEFISAYQIQESDLLVPKGGLRDENPAIKPFILSSFDKLDTEQDLARPCWLAPWRIVPDLATAYGAEAYRAFFRDALFNERIRALFLAVDALDLPEKRVALHVRGGDVIYDGARHTHTFGRIKTVSLAVAEALCAHFTGQGYTVLLFGASTADLDFLASGKTDVLTVGQLGLGEVDLSGEVLRDVWLMAGCEQIVAAEDTGVTKLAVLVGRAEPLPFTQLLPPAEEYRVSRDCVASGRVADYHILQQAFVHYSLFITAPETVDIETLFEHVHEAHRCDPDNVQYMALCLLSAHALGRQTEIDRFEGEMARALGEPAAACFSSPELRRRYVPLRQPTVQRLLGAIAPGAGTPGYIRDLPRTPG